jgi:glucose/mannose-6-phosphate isomerase
MSYEEAEESISKYSEFVKIGWNAGQDIKFFEEIDSVVICGMGASSISGDLLRTYLDINVPIFIVRNYKIPSFISKKALVFIISYSGETEEMISCFKSALGKGCYVVGVTSGGKLEDMCVRAHVKCVKVKPGFSPRSGFPMLFFGVLRVLNNSRLIEDQEDYVEKTIDVLKGSIFKQKGAELAEKLVGNIPLIYGSNQYEGVSYRWKTQLNENAKVMAFSNTFPEMVHNELQGFEDVDNSYYAIMILDESDHPKIKKKMELTKQLIAEKKVSSTIISVKGSCKLSKIMSAIYIGDWTSFFLAKLKEIDPTPIGMIDRLKKSL